MSNDPYAAPTADLQTDGAVIETSTWSAKGRLGRLSYLGQAFLATLVWLIVIGVIAGVLAATGSFDGINPDALDASALSNPMAIVGGILLFLTFIAFIYIYACLLIKRLHDRNHSGWWALPLMVLSAIPIIGLIAFIGHIYVMCAPGNKDSNRNGAKRATKGWEKVMGILYIVLIVLAVVGGAASVFMGISGV